MIKRTLYFGNPAYLSLKNEQLVIRLPVENGVNDLAREEYITAKTIPIEDIGILLLDNGQITITSGLIERLLDNTCAVITCDSRRMPSGLLLPLSGNTVQNERFRCQLNASFSLRENLWQQTIKQKILNQVAVLDASGMNCADMRIRAGRVKPGDPDNIEASAAAYYWKNLFPSYPSFVRDREGSCPNNLLNYGYAVLRATMARSLVVSGLLPTLGIHHHNRYNDFCLADDMMEPYRPYVDRLVLDITKEEEDIIELSKETKSRLLSIPTMDVVISGKRRPLMIAASYTTASLYKCFSGETETISFPEM